MRRKITALFLLVALCVSQMIVPVSAGVVESESDAEAVITIGEIKAPENAEGKKIIVPVTLAFKNSGTQVDAVGLEFKYDTNVLTLTAFKTGDVDDLNNNPLTLLYGATDNSGQGIVTWASVQKPITSDSINTRKGALVNLEFEVKEGYLQGTYEITGNLALPNGAAEGSDRGANFAYNTTPVDVYFKAGSVTFQDGLTPEQLAPTISAQPQSAAYSYPNTTVTALSVTAEPANGAEANSLAYQWYSNTANSTTGGTAISGATNNTYTPAALTTFGTTYYYCVVTNTYQGKTYAATSNVAAVTYAKAEIASQQAISITPPTKGGEPQAEIKPANANYTGQIEWTPEVKNNKFAANTAYTASVTLTANENYRFASGFNPAVAEATVSGGTLNDDGTYSFKAAFDKTSDKELQGISAELKTPGKAYAYGDTVAESDVTVTATYDTGTETVAGDYTISYGNNKGCLAVGDNTVTVTFGDETDTVNVNNVGQKPITVKANDATRAYGQANPTDLDFTITNGALVGNDTKSALGVTLNFVSEIGPNTAVGEHANAITGTSNSANYDVTVTPGTLTITKAKVTSAKLNGAAALTVSKSKAEVLAAKSLTALGLPTLATLRFEGGTPADEDVNAAYNKTLADIQAAADTVDATSGDKTVVVTLTDKCFLDYAEAGSGLTMPKVTIKITSKHEIPAEDITFNNVTTTYGTDAKVEATVTPNVDKYNGVNYTYTYQKDGVLLTGKPTDAGKYTVTVTVENDNYKGSKTAALTIGQKAVTAAVTAENKVYDGAKTAAVKAEVNKAELVSGDSIEITGLTGAFDNADVGNDKPVTVDTSKSVISGKGSENYNITFDTNNVTANITPKKITAGMIGSIADQAYTGSAITPAVVVKDGGKTLTKDVDYTVAYANNTDAGKASVTVAGKGNYTGEVTATFTITQKSINGATVAVAGGSVYTGSPIEPKVTVTLDGQKLDPSNYDAAYSKNTNAGEASVTVTGKGNYTGTATAAFTIAPKPIDGTTVAIEPIGSQTYTGSPITPAVVVKDDGKALVKDVDYKVTYAGNTDAGQATVTIAGKGNYTGSAKASFAIEPKSIGDQTVTALLQSVKGKTSVVSLSSLIPADQGGTVVYTVTGAANHADASEANGKLTLTFKEEAAELEDETLTVTASGMKNYKDCTIKVTIQYTDKEVLALNVVPNGSLVYDGKAKDVTVTGAPAGVELEYSYSGVSAKGENYNEAAAPSNAGSYTATVTVKENANYTGSAAANFTIKPAAATIKANDVSIFVGDALPTTYDVTVTPDGVTAEDVKATCPTGDPNAAGTYPIIVSGSSVSQDGNYNIAYENGALTVKNKAVATPEATPNGGSFTGSQQVTLTCDTPDAKIYYTTDGSEPTTNSTLYEAPFTLSASATVKAIAVKEGMENSPVLSVAFTKNSGGGSGGDGGDGGSSSGGKTETTTESDGSVVTTTKNDDGSTTINTKKPDGTTSTEVKKPDGSSKTTTQTKDGSSSVVNIDADGKTTAEVTLSAAASDGKTAALPMPAVKASSDFAKAPAVTIKTAGNQPAKVEIPVSNGNAGTVAVLVQADGTEKIIKTSVLTENGLALAVNSGDQIKIVDNSKSFADTASHWGKDSIQFVTSRELFVGTSATEFSPDSTMTRGMLMTVLARFEDVNTSGGATWYEKGVSWAKNNSLSDGANPDANISREQLVTILYRYAASKNVAVGGGADMSAYHDAGQISEWAKDAMSWAVQNGIINGMDDGALAPAGNATRTQVAAVIERYAKLFMA